MLMGMVQDGFVTPRADDPAATEPTSTSQPQAPVSTSGVDLELTPGVSVSATEDNDDNSHREPEEPPVQAPLPSHDLSGLTENQQ